jgi:branched-chain amino acid transport system substrate-binding protein
MMKRLTTFLVLALVQVCTSLGLISLGPVHAQERVIRVGIVAPDQGSLGILGTQLRAGFLIYEQQFINDNLRFDVVEETEICEANSGADTAYALEEARVDLVVGFLCVESLVSAMPILAQNNIPVLNINIRSDIVRDEAARLSWPLFSLAPRASDQAKFASKYVIKNWGDKSVALIEDGTISNREMIDAVRLQLEDGGFQPIVLDNFRPGQAKQFGIVRRMGKSNISHVFVGASRSDTAIIARDAECAGGDTLRAADDDLTLPNGTIAIMPNVALEGQNAALVREQFDLAGIFPDRLPVLGYAMAEIVTKLADVNPDDIQKAMVVTGFDTVIGTVTFDQYGERNQDVFQAMVWQDGRFISKENIK